MPATDTADIALSNAPRPAGQADRYRFFTDAGGRMFKAAVEPTTAATGDPALVVTVSQVDADGKALVEATGAPLVASHTHTFTQVELADPSFDLESRVAAVLVAAVGERDRVAVGRQAIANLDTKWRGSARLKTTPPAAIAAPGRPPA